MTAGPKPKDSLEDGSVTAPVAPDAETIPRRSSSAGSLLAVPNPKGRIDKIPVVGFFWNLYRGYSRRNGPLLSAGISYYALFSLGPLLLLTLQITGRLFGTGSPSAADRVKDVAGEYVGEDMAAMLSGVINYLTTSSTPTNRTFAIVSIAILLYGATRLFVRLQASFNIMWDVRVVSRAFSVTRLLSRLLVFAMILIPTILLLVALVLGTAIYWLQGLLGSSGILIGIAQAAIPFLLAWLGLMTLFVVLPDIRLRIRDCWFTSLLVAVAWAVGTRVFSTYLSWTGGQQYAGAVGALIGVIFWVDVLAIITLVGVRFNKAIYLWRGKTIEYYEYAAPVMELPDGEVAAQAASLARGACGDSQSSGGSASSPSCPPDIESRGAPEPPAAGEGISAEGQGPDQTVMSPGTG